MVLTLTSLKKKKTKKRNNFLNSLLFLYSMKQISSGAEAIIYQHNELILKDRIKKDYRISTIDEQLRKFRTNREAKVLEKLENINFPAPRLISKEKTHIKMQYLDGKQLKAVLEKSPAKYGKEIGKLLAELHNNNIIHSDLTTSNMILKDKDIYFIDFGLSFFSHKVEDKAVDLHLLKQALESKHYKCFEKCFRAVLEAYKANFKDSETVLQRLEKVELRGRNKSK